ncbi:hypothetical protein [Allobaculum mucilyticum]|uniref:hypothetical protein n=1 Tax=Allobaculum mucilyticum TaxID=2834459 RepID=UPI001F6110F9|nr:hypothetical protein [Allobaculum mucilyticum]UNT96461.1 hypothetical protein KWG62_01480 [Allobaculum mucilyticum]
MILFKGGSSVSASAVSQARSKINSSLYKNVFNRFNKATSSSDVKTFKGYRLPRCRWKRDSSSS